MIHGFAKAKNIFPDVCEVGEEGIITAYLPEMQRFAISFDGKIPSDRWTTFKMSEEQFLENFEVELNESKQNPDSN